MRFVIVDSRESRKLACLAFCMQRRGDREEKGWNGWNVLSVLDSQIAPPQSRVEDEMSGECSNINKLTQLFFVLIRLDGTRKNQTSRRGEDFFKFLALVVACWVCLTRCDRLLWASSCCSCLIFKKKSFYDGRASLCANRLAVKLVNLRNLLAGRPLDTFNV